MNETGIGDLEGFQMTRGLPKKKQRIDILHRPENYTDTRSVSPEGHLTTIKEHTPWEPELLPLGFRAEAARWACFGWRSAYYNSYCVFSGQIQWPPSSTHGKEWVAVCRTHGVAEAGSVGSPSWGIWLRGREPHGNPTPCLSAG